MKISYDIMTSVLTDGVIDQTISSNFNDVKTIVQHQILETMDAQVRLALIHLGWTPPEKPSNDDSNTSGQDYQ